MIKAILFDLDGTLLPIDENKFIDLYISLLAKEAVSIGYDKDNFVKSLWTSTKKMYENNGIITNEDVFWKTFSEFQNKDVSPDKIFFNKFYETKFLQTKSVCEDNPLAKQIIEYAKNNFKYVILATNPLFPKVATLKRMSFVNLDENDFSYITTYENSSYSKPNPNYFKNLLEKFNLKPDEVILFGNNVIEDAICAERVGIKTILVGKYIINSQNIKHNYLHIDMEEVIGLLENIKNSNK